MASRNLCSIQYKLDPTPEPSDEDIESSDEEEDGFGSKKKEEEDEDPAASNDDDEDLYIIGAVCLSVCLSVCNENAYFPYSKDFVVSPVYRHFP